MKKFLLLGAAALLACSANAQLTKVWEHNMAAYTTVQTRSIGAVGNKALVPNAETGKVEVWGANGKEKEYDVNAWLATNATGNTLGRGISTDEAGNIITNLNFPAMTSCNNFVAIKPNGDMMYIPCVIPGSTDFKEGESGRCDFLGDKTAGDVTSNAFIITCPNACSYAMAFNIYEGAQDKDFSYGVKLGDNDNTETWNTESSAIALAKLADGAQQAPKFITRNRGISSFRVSKDGKSNLEKYATSIEWKAATTTNFTAFVVNDVEYAVVNQEDNGTRTHSWKVFNLKDQSVVASWTMPAGEAVNYNVGFASTVNEDGTVNIFQFNPGKRLAMYTLNLNSGISNITADDNAPVEYYNLQGVKVENPENGIFIKKQGSKTEKFIAQ